MNRLAVVAVIIALAVGVAVGWAVWGRGSGGPYRLVECITQTNPFTEGSFYTDCSTVEYPSRPPGWSSYPSCIDGEPPPLKPGGGVSYPTRCIPA